MPSRPGGSSRPGRRTRRPARTTSRAAARPAASRRQVAAAREEKRGHQLTGRAVVLVGIVVLLLASYTSSLHTWWDQRREIQSQKTEIALRKERIADLEDQKDRWNDPAFVKAEARKRFGWVLPGEVGYRVIGSDGTVVGDAPTLDAPPVPEADRWYDTLWGSVEQAGRDPVEVAEEAAVPDTPLEQQ